MRLSADNQQRIVVWLLLIAIMAGAALHRVSRYKERPFYHPRSDLGFFYTEEAFQYRYTRMVADDEAIPRLDKKAQWPEGIYPFRELTLFQEYLHGNAFRLFSAFSGAVPLHVFLIYFVCFFSSLTVPALYAGARTLGAGRWAALFCSALYAFTGAAFARVVFYELELTAFPLTALSFAAGLYALRGSRYAPAAAVVAGGLLAAALITWHFTRFYLLVFWVAMGGAFLLLGGNRRRVAVAAVILLFTAAVGVLSPVMRNSGLLGSPTMLAGVLVVIGLYHDDKHGWTFPSRLALLLAGAAGIVMVLGIGGEDFAYGHVWGLLKYKLINVLIKPADPADLPFAGRILWNGPFRTPSFHLFVYRYGLLLPLALIALFRFVTQRRPMAAFGDMMVVFMAVLFLAVNLMVQRMTIFGAFFLGLVLAYLFTPRPENAWPKTAAPGPAFPFFNRRFLSGVILAACLVFQVREALLCDQTWFARLTGRIFPDHSTDRNIPYTGDEISLLVWIRENTADDAVFLSHQGNSPSLLTYAGRAINLHPKLETAGLRKKYEIMLMTLFGEDEEALYRLLESFETDYYLCPASNLLQTDMDGERYMAGLSRVSRRSLVYRLHFEPDSFRRLRLVFRNRYSQIYRFVDKRAPAPDGAGYRAPYYPVYDLNLFTVPGSRAGDCFDDTLVEPVLERVVHTLRMMGRAKESLSRGEREMTARWIQQALTAGLPDGYAFYRAAEYMVRLDNLDQALTFIRQALACDPENIEFRRRLARIHVLRDEPDRALAVLTAVRREARGDPVLYYNDLGVAFWKKKAFADARQSFLRALALDPEDVYARHNLEVMERSRQP